MKPITLLDMSYARAAFPRMLEDLERVIRGKHGFFQVTLVHHPEQPTTAPAPGSVDIPASVAAPASVEERRGTYTTSDPTDPNLGRGVDEKPVPQNKAYLVLSPEERAKGFVRPVRRTYIHCGQQSKYPLRDLTPEEKERWPDYVKFEDYPESESPHMGRGWTQRDLDNRGCGTHTTMSRDIAESYARCPDMYGSTYCCHCMKHLRVGEFAWIESDGSVGPTVGS